MGLLLGTKARTEQVPRFDPTQLAQQRGIGQMAYQGLKNTNLDFAPIKQEAQRRFQSETIPGLLERLQGFGGEGAMRSSALGQQLSAAGTGLESQLAGMESQYNLQKFQNLLGAFQQGQQSPWDTIQHAAQPGLLHSLAGGAGQALPLMALLSMYGQNNQTGTSTGPQASSTGGGSSLISRFINALIGGAGGFMAGGPAGAAIGAGTGLMKG